ncbi:MAG: carbamate kinase [Ignavibacteriales bacterium]|nr:carbamate kinase [Ignavibacteriales bacterium]
MNKLALVAIGGNSMIRSGQQGTIDEQRANIEQTCEHLSEILKLGFRLVITHGNGPQVGNQLLRVEAGEKYSKVSPEPLDVCGADTQGMLGYLLQQSMNNVLMKKKLHYNVCTIVTQCVVEENDPGFWYPSKPIGPFYSKEDSDKKIETQHWVMKEDAGRGYRRLVASPKPIEIVEEEIIHTLVEKNYIVITVGGGGIPVVRKNGKLVGVEAVIDKDRASAFLAQKLKADYFIISTDADKVCLNYKKPNQVMLDKLSLAEAKQHLKDGQFPPGNMGPKIEAVIDFLSSGGHEAIITSPDNILRAVKGEGGTHVTNN